MTKQIIGKRAIERALGQHAPKKKKPKPSDHRSSDHRRDACATEPPQYFSAWSGCSLSYEKVLPVVKKICLKIAEKIKDWHGDLGLDDHATEGRQFGFAIRAFIWLLQDDLDRPEKLTASYFIIEEGVFIIPYRGRGELFLDSIPLDRPALPISVKALLDSRYRLRMKQVELAAKRLTSFYARQFPLSPWNPRKGNE